MRTANIRLLEAPLVSFGRAGKLQPLHGSVTQISATYGQTSTRISLTAKSERGLSYFVEWGHPGATQPGRRNENYDEYEGYGHIAELPEELVNVIFESIGTGSQRGVEKVEDFGPLFEKPQTLKLSKVLIPTIQLNYHVYYGVSIVEGEPGTADENSFMFFDKNDEFLGALLRREANLGADYLTVPEFTAPVSYALLQLGFIEKTGLTLGLLDVYRAKGDLLKVTGTGPMADTGAGFDKS